MRKKVKYFIGFLILFLCSACTEYFEVLDRVSIDYELLRPDVIDTDDKLVVLNIAVDSSEFSHMYTYYNEEIEIYGTLSVFRNKALIFSSENARFKVKGRASRAYPLKSLGIRFEKPECNRSRSIIRPQSINDLHNIDLIQSLRLRNSGNDFMSDRNATLIKDISYTRLAVEANLNIDLMYSEQAVVFLNNSFLGLMNLRTESTARAIAHKYKVNPDDITLAKVTLAEVEVQNGNYDRVMSLLQAIENKNLNFLYSQIDIDNFIDYVVYNTYIANTDWPHNNIKFFATDTSKFRFFMFDLDYANYSHHNRTPLQILERVTKNPITDLFLLFYEDESFRKLFYQRFAELLESEKINQQHFQIIVERHYENIKAYMPYHIAKYQHPPTLAEWYKNVALLQTYFAKREQYIKKIVLK